MRNSQPNLILSDPDLISDTGDASGWSADSDLISPVGWPSGSSLIGRYLISGNQSSLASASRCVSALISFRFIFASLHCVFRGLASYQSHSFLFPMSLIAARCKW
jgi:hypothetical protein